MLDSFLPFDLEFTSSAASVLIILDDILRIVPIGTSVKRRGSKILLDMKQRGSVPAQLRQNELDRLNRLARRLWERFPTSMGRNRTKSLVPGGEKRPRTSAPTQEQTNMLISAGDPALAPTNNDHINHQTHHPLAQDGGDTGAIFSQAPPQSLLSSPVLTQNATTPFDLISPDLAEQFELSQEQMLFVADQLNADADDALFLSNLDFGASGGASGSGSNWLWSMS